MNEASKNKWIAVVISLIVAAFFFGAVFFYSINRNVENKVNNVNTNSNNNNNIIPMTNATTSPDGLIIEEVVIGNGEQAKAGQTVSVNYTGTLQNGTKFDSSYDRGQPITFTLGVGQVIKGWEQGIAGMKVGGKRKLIIPSTLAYGSQAVGDVIPANATLLFDVELVGIQK